MLRDPQTQTTIDRDTFTITFTRTIGAPPARVFDAWTRPEDITRWWDPTGRPLAACRVDLRVGGEFLFTNAGDVHSPPFAGTYRRIERPNELEFAALGAIGTVRLAAVAGGTAMTVSIRCATAAHFAQFLAIGIPDGTARTLDNLAAHLAAEPRGAAVTR